MMVTQTRTEILTHAERAVRRHGYAGFSYADLTEVVGIRKASIHHHFPAKPDLGVALIEAYTERFDAALAAITQASPSAPDRLAAYAGLYRSALVSGQGCLCGVLAAELATLPNRLRQGVARFFEAHLAWLTLVIESGQFMGTLRPDQTARQQAGAVLAGLQGALLLGQALADPAVFDSAAATTLDAFAPSPPNAASASPAPGVTTAGAAP